MKIKLPPLTEKMLVITTPSLPEWKAEPKGLVSGHCVIGTGPISSFLSSFSDFAGGFSNTYQDKIHEAEKMALYYAQVEAIKKGGNAICGCSISVTEATSGHGMIMVSCVGTAIKFDDKDDPIFETVGSLYKRIYDIDLKISLIDNALGIS